VGYGHICMQLIKLQHPSFRTKITKPVVKTKPFACQTNKINVHQWLCSQ